LDDLVDSRGIVAIEWAERWPGRPRRAIDVQLEESGEGRRRIRVARPV
jgi:tRNA A37 threonylcarbamoyladenosine biosynthesis protein TsaE